MIETGGGRCVAAGLFVAAMALAPLQAWGQAKPEDSPLLKPIDKTHCLAFYDVVELRLKGKGDEVTSITTRNGLKDFFVTRPGEVDCTGQREIPWRDDKDREFIASVLKEAGDALKSKVDLAKTYGIGPAPRATTPRL
jgi:hypothetical protein